MPIDQTMSSSSSGGTLLTENTDYTLQWNANYTSLEIVLKDGTQKYFIEYDTTTPNDGSTVANYISLTKEDGTKVTQRSNNTRTELTATSVSRYSGSIVANTANRIKIIKVDEFSLAPVPGAVYTITAEDGSVPPQELQTDSLGIALTTEYPVSMVGKTFIVKEKTAPTGYQVDPTEYKVKLTANGTLVHLKDTPVPAQVTITAQKNLTGRRIVDQEFTFKLYDANGNEVAEAKNDLNGQITFSGVELKGTGTYNYSIGEVDTQNGGVTFDLERKNVTIEVRRGADGFLQANVTSQPAVFNNSYTAQPAKVSLTAQKTLIGRSLKDREFTFELYKTTGELVATGYNDTNGLVTFPDFAIDSPGLHTFKVKEVVENLGGVTYDQTEQTVTVDVVDNQQGQLVATVTSATPSFTNNYAASPAKVTISARKTLDGRDLQAEEFEFVLTDQDGQEVGRAKNAANGTISFAELTITKADTYTYTISEVKGNLGGVTYDQTPVKATVVVTDNQEGALEAVVTYENSEQTFENTYSASPAKFTLSARKTLDGRDLLAEEFEFVLTDQDGQEVGRAKNAANGTISFAELTITKADTYTYTISEVKGNLGGVTYDQTPVKATVEVTGNQQGALEAVVTYENNDQTFENTYSASPVKVKIPAVKRLDGRDLKADELNSN